MIKSVRTTICGLICAAAAFVAMYGSDLKMDPHVVAGGKFIMAGGLAALGINAKDGKDGNPDQGGDQK